MDSLRGRLWNISWGSEKCWHVAGDAEGHIMHEDVCRLQTDLGLELQHKREMKGGAGLWMFVSKTCNPYTIVLKGGGKWIGPPCSIFPSAFSLWSSNSSSGNNDNNKNSSSSSSKESWKQRVWGGSQTLIPLSLLSSIRKCQMNFYSLEIIVCGILT